MRARFLASGEPSFAAIQNAVVRRATARPSVNKDATGQRQCVDEAEVLVRQR